MAKLKTVAKKLRKSLPSGKQSNSNSDDQSTNVPEDVKEGHLPVISMDKDDLKIFVVPLNYLNNPTFFRLSEQAAEE